MLQPLVLIQVGFCASFELTFFTRKGPLPSMFLHVLPQIPFAFTFILTARTLENGHFRIFMYLGHVDLLLKLWCIYLWTNRAREPLVICVPLYVKLQIVLSCKHFVTHGAWIALKGGFVHSSLLPRKVVFIFESLLAKVTAKPPLVSQFFELQAEICFPTVRTSQSW